MLERAWIFDFNQLSRYGIKQSRLWIINKFLLGIKLAYQNNYLKPLYIYIYICALSIYQNESLTRSQF